MQDDRKDAYWEMGDLLAKYPDLTPDEQLVFDAWLQQEGHEALWKEISSAANLQQRLNEWALLEESKELYRQKQYAKIGYIIPQPKKKHLWGWLAAAASVILVLTAGYLWIQQRNTGSVATTVQNNEVETPSVKPGGFKAKLTLADGSIVYLDSAASGKLATQGQIQVESNGQQLVYEGSGRTASNMYNTLTTGRGESYAVKLSDGTQVWLNAASSVRYPVVFTGNERTVEVTGEAYFDVQKDVHKPFIIQAGEAEVKVLGTEFNINAYPEENAVTTTLLRGKVQLSKGTRTKVLIPGQQAALLATGEIALRDNADIEKATGWKNGLFVFKGDDIQAIMNQLARWYDVTITYQGDIPADRFYGMISRDQPLSTVLEVLQKSNIHFKLQGRTITVTP